MRALKPLSKSIKNIFSSSVSKYAFIKGLPKAYYSILFRNDYDLIELQRQILRSSFTDTNDIFRHLISNAHLTNETLNLKSVFNTTTHDQMYNTIVNLATHLNENEYCDTIGISSLVLVGPRGIGKTTTLKNMAVLIPVLFPKVIPIYINYSKVLTNETLQKRCLKQIVTKVLEQYLRHTIKEGAEHEDIVLALKKSDLFVLIIVDEIDKMYEVDPCKHVWYETMTRTLGDLAGIGDDDSGRISAVLCGSSCEVVNLINANAKTDPLAVKEFPLVALAPNLNDTKFRTTRVYSPDPTDLEAVRGVTGFTDVETQRVLAFMCGSVARELQCFTLSKKDPTSLQSFIVDRQVSNTLQGTSGHLYSIIMKLLYEKNENLMKQFLIEGALDESFIKKQPWEKQFQPLKLEELEDNINKSMIDITNLDYWIYHLFDRDYITVSGVRMGRPELIFPYSMFRLARQ